MLSPKRPAEFSPAPMSWTTSGEPANLEWLPELESSISERSMTVSPSSSSSAASAAPTRGTPPAIRRETRSALSSLETRRYILSRMDCGSSPIWVRNRSMSMSGEARMMWLMVARRPRTAGLLRVDEPFHGEEGAHRVGEDVDALGVGPHKDVGHVLELDARDERAVEVVDIAARAGRGGPGEEHWHALETRVLDELRQPKECIACRVVVAVDEDQQLALAHRAGGEFAVDLGDEGRVGAVHHRIDDRELGARVGRQALRSFKLSQDVVRRNGDIDRGEAELRRTAGRVEGAHNLGRLARRGDENAVPAEVGHGFVRDRRVVDAYELRRAAAPNQHQSDERHDHGQETQAVVNEMSPGCRGRRAAGRPLDPARKLTRACSPGKFMIEALVMNLGARGS